MKTLGIAITAQYHTLQSLNFTMKTYNGLLPTELSRPDVSQLDSSFRTNPRLVARLILLNCSDNNVIRLLHDKITEIRLLHDKIREIRLLQN